MVNQQTVYAVVRNGDYLELLIDEEIAVNAAIARGGTVKPIKPGDLCLKDGAIYETVRLNLHPVVLRRVQNTIPWELENHD